jgi:uncharacterized delta-60 repeat protein
MMIRVLRSQALRWRLLIPLTTLALILSPHAQIAMHAADGDRDVSFGAGGIVTTDFGGNFDGGNAIAVQGDGKIVAAGASHAGLVGDFAVARYNPDGSLDTTFGTGGQVTLDLGGGSNDVARALAIQADGKIVVAGDTTGALPPWDHNFAVVRYNSNGTLDPTFEGDGIAITDFGSPIFEGAMSVAIQSDGRIVAAGAAFNPITQLDFAVARYNPDGSLDASFHGDGRVTTPISLVNFDAATSVAIHADGRIVALGFSGFDAALVRYNADGSLDATFGGGTGTGPGIVTTDYGGASDRGMGLAIQPDGKLVTVGRSSGAADFVLARYDGNGALDATFGTGGLVATDFPDASGSGSGVALQVDGKIIAIGRYNAGMSTGDDFAVARYDTSGALDPTFGGGSGFVTTDVAASADDPRGVAIQPDGRILVVGQTVSGLASAQSDFVVIRYEGPTPHDLTFYLRGDDVEYTAGSYTMNLTPSSQQILLPPTPSPAWFSDPLVNGTFLAGATFQVRIPCPLGVAFVKTVRIASTDTAGGTEQPLGEFTAPVEICEWQTVTIPVQTPTTLRQRRLKVTIASPYPDSPPIILGDQTYFRATNFLGTP